MRRPGLPFGIVVLALIAGALLLIPRHPAPLRVSDLGLTPPLLRIPGSRAWDRELHRVLTIVTPDGCEDRFLFERGRGHDHATLLRADPDTPAWDVLAAGWKRALKGEVWPRFYLGGIRPDGSVVALPMFVGTRLEETQVYSLGDSIQASYRWGSDRSEGVFEVRVTREGQMTRFRWGRSPLCKTAVPRRFRGGDVTLPEREIGAEGRGPLLPGLAELLAERFTVPGGRRAIVTLEIGTGVSNVDLARVVECGGGDPDVWFVPRYVGHGTLPRVRLPELGAPEDAALLVEGARLDDRRIIATVRANGSLWRKGLSFEPEEFPLPATATLQIHCDEKAPWERCSPLLLRAQDAGLAIDFIFAPEDPQIPWERLLHVPVAEDGERLELRDGATAGVAFRTILRRLREGARAFRFE